MFELQITKVPDQERKKVVIADSLNIENHNIKN